MEETRRNNFNRNNLRIKGVSVVVVVVVVVGGGGGRGGYVNLESYSFAFCFPQ